MNFLSKNRISIISAIILVLFQIFWIKELFQWLIANLVGVGISELTFNIVSISHYFEPATNTPAPVLILLYLAPAIYLIISIEIASVFLRKSQPGPFSTFNLVFVLSLLGYLLIYIFYNAVILILNPALENEWIAMSIYLGFEQPERIIFAFGVIFLFVFYLNISTKRVTSNLM